MRTTHAVTIESVNYQLNLSAIPEFFHKDAIEGFIEGDVGRIFVGASNELSMAIVRDNLFALLGRGIYEEAIFDAYTGTRTNNAGWTLRAIGDLLGIANREKLRSAGDPLPGANPFTVYRGVAGDGPLRRVRSYSWTLDLDTACWFACRYDLPNKTVYVATVTPDDVFFAYDGRDEREIVCRPAKCKKMKLTPAEIKAGHARQVKIKEARSPFNHDANGDPTK